MGDEPGHQSRAFLCLVACHRSRVVDQLLAIVVTSPWGLGCKVEKNTTEREAHSSEALSSIHKSLPETSFS